MILEVDRPSGMFTKVVRERTCLNNKVSGTENLIGESELLDTKEK